MFRPDAPAAPLIAAVLALGLAGPAAVSATESPQARLDETERALAASKAESGRLAVEAEALARELATLERDSIEAARKAQASEESLSEAEAFVAIVEHDLRQRETGLAGRRAEMARLVAMLQRLSRQPAEAMLVAPGGPIAVARSGAVLSALVPRLAEEARTLRGEIEALDDTRQAAARQQAALAEASARLARDREALNAIVARRLALLGQARQAAEAAGARADRLAAQSHDLKDLIARLAREEAAAQAEAKAAAVAALSAPAAPPRPFSEAQGQLVPPVRGPVLRAFGEPDQGGHPHKGLTLAARSQAQIVAPFDGRVAFAGPFRGYGRILILEHSEGYHTLMAGFGRIDAAVGQMVVAGEPLGETDDIQDGNVAFYVELRHGGQPVDPLPWLATVIQKVRG